MVDRILRLSHKVGRNPACQGVRSVRCREVLAPRGTKRNVHLQIAHQGLYSDYIGYCAALKVIAPCFNDASRNNKHETKLLSLDYFDWST
jgi:hypothetical protein